MLQNIDSVIYYKIESFTKQLQFNINILFEKNLFLDNNIFHVQETQ